MSTYLWEKKGWPNYTWDANAQRDLADLVKKGILLKNPGGVRSISDDLNWGSIRQLM